MTSFINKMKRLRDLYETNLEDKTRKEIYRLVTQEKLRLIEIVIREYEKWLNKKTA